MIRRNQDNRLVEYLATACTNTGQATFYNTRAEQAAALAALHAEILASDRRVYALSAALPINDRNRQLVLQNLLATGRDVTDRELENLVVAYVTRELPFNRALNLLVDLCRAKVNNARLRRVCRLLWNQYADAYRVIKYRTKFRTLLRHCHISEGDEPRRAELHRWLFGRLRDAAAVRHNALLRMRLLAARDVQHCYQLPLDIGRDIAVNCHGMKASDFTRNYVGKDGQQGHGRATRKETLRASEQAQTDVDYNRFTLLELLRHAYGARDEQRAEELQRLEAVMQGKAAELGSHMQLPARVHVIVDNSGSARGSDERSGHALAVIEATSRVLQAVPHSQVTCHYVGNRSAALLAASGSTDLRTPLARALAARPDMVVILSDGYENVAAGSVAQMLATRAVRESGIPLVHLNPVAAAETGGLRTLSADLPAFGLSDPRQLAITLLLGHAAQDPRRLLPLFDRVEEALKGGDHEVARIAQRLGYLSCANGR